MNDATSDGFRTATSHKIAAPTPERTHGAYELKFLINDQAAAGILQWARTNLSPDPHADHTIGDGYRVHSLYFDTPALDVYRRSHCSRGRKFRLRRYGSESRVFLERKSKSSGLVRKRRTVISDSELQILSGLVHDPAWPGHWFQRRMMARRLAPKCQVSYERVARVGMTSEGPIRLTLDRGIRCQRADEIAVPAVTHGTPILVGRNILELKFRVALPALFKGALQEFNLNPTSVSKYRLSMDMFMQLVCELPNLEAVSPVTQSFGPVLPTPMTTDWRQRLVMGCEMVGCRSIRAAI